jgi:hypothetical protein
MARSIKKTKIEKKGVLIALEDTKSSKYYFQSLVKDSGLSGKVVFAKHIGTNPSKVLEAITSAPRYQKDYEKQWIVIDKDDWSKSDFNGTIKQAKELGVCCAFSNESYELWILLHFENLRRYTSRVELNKKLKEIFLDNFSIEYSKASSDIYAVIKSRQQEAIKNTKSLIKKHLRDDGEIKPFEQNPLTNIFELVECLEALGKNNSTDCKCHPNQELN